MKVEDYSYFGTYLPRQLHCDKEIISNIYFFEEWFHSKMTRTEAEVNEYGRLTFPIFN